MFKITSIRRKVSFFLVFIVTFLFIFQVSFPSVNAKEKPKPEPKDWHISGIVAALDDVYPEVQELAFDNLGGYELKNLNKQQANWMAKKAVNLLKDEKIDSSVRGSAVSALGNLGDAAKPYVQDILAFLKDEKVEDYIRGSAAYALGNLGDAAKPYVKDIAAIVKDEKVEDYVRFGAARALGNLGDAAKPYVQDILAIVKDEKVDSSVRSSAALALENLGDAAKPYVQDILAFLKDEKVYSNNRDYVAKALGKIDKLNLNQVLLVLNNFYDPKDSQLDEWRFLTYFLAGGTEEVKILLKWLGHYNNSKIPTKLEYKEAKKTLQLFAKIWQPSKGLRLRKDTI